MDFQSLGLGGIAVLIILDKVGILDKVLRRNGNGNGHGLTNGKQDQINKELFDHASTANSEMAEIKTDIAVIKTKMGYIEEGVKEIKDMLKR